MIRNESNTVPFRELEKNCEQVFRMNPSYWHLYTDGRNSEILFRNEEELKEAMNMIAIACISFNDVKVFTFELMNNHLHAILAGPPSSCELMFLEIKKKLRMNYARSGRVVNFDKFNCRLLEITSLQSLRNEIVYVNRNGYVARPDCTPFSYPWGAGACLFNPFLRHLPSVSYDDLTIREKRKLCRSNNVDLGRSHLMVYDGVILPSGYCVIAESESFFRNAHHYYNLLSKRYEAYSEVASHLHESIFIADEEMYSAVCALCLKYYNVKTPTQLAAKDKVEMARKMRQDYNASNRQIKSILRLEAELVNELFPE